MKPFFVLYDFRIVLDHKLSKKDAEKTIDFCYKRLGIKEKVEANQWLSRAEQGIILHNILEKWVKAYPTQTRLFELSIPERENHFKKLIQDKFAQYRLKK